MRSVARHWPGRAIVIVSVACAASAMVLPGHAQTPNLALQRMVTRSSDVSSGRAPNAVDGDVATYWQPLMSDRTDNLNVWIRVDLDGPKRVDKAVLNFRTAASRVDEFFVRASQDGITFQEVYRSTGALAAVTTALFEPVTARFLRVDFTLNAGGTPNFQLNELELYDSGAVPPPPALSSISIADTTGRVYAPGETVSLRVGSELRLLVTGRLSNGDDADLEGASVAIESSKPAVASIDADRAVRVLSAGVTRMTATATLQEVTKDTHLWIDAYDPATLIADARLTHPTMVSQIGRPAILSAGSEFPAVHVAAHVGVTVGGELVRPDSSPAVPLPELHLAAGAEEEIRFPGTADTKGLYQIRLRLMTSGGQRTYDAFFFTVMDPADVPADQSAIAYVGPGASLIYVPDYKGNQILDVSNSGYMGGGVKLPEVQARVAVSPAEGDDTARIQTAIDEVSRMPQDAAGIRGAVLLEAGRFEVDGTLFIRAGGVVLRGEGQGENGTVLHATGAARRDVLVIRGEGGRMLLDTRTSIADLYVPAGAHEFHVEDPSAFRVGDAVVLRRNGNDRWIHHIGMDQIFERPGGSPGETSQWGPFSLDFDRVITGIDGNRISVDAPLANAIERRWGGGELIGYDDPDRIEQVGVENLRVDVAFDPSVTAVNDGQTYFADENHAVRFAVLDNVKNAWVRDVTTLHLEHSLANVLRQAKWVTVQDSSAIDMVSRIDGGRRYNYALAGQLTLVQRCHAETARHAFVVDSRVPGPNVFLDSDSVTEYATSEPHHRWSVGGLFDNVRGDIAIQDRAWLGSGHGWAGANYVAWNTDGGLVAQQPPTAQNYAIGHVGPKRNPFVPNSDDRRPRQDGYWEKLGQHVSPRSLYLQQLQERLGVDGVLNIARTAIGGGTIDVPTIDEDLPVLKGIKVGGKPLEHFSPMVFDYVVTLPGGTTEVPDLKPHDHRHLVEYQPAFHANGRSVLILRDRLDPRKSTRYTIRFVTPE